MKILVTSTPGTGHIHPLAPLMMRLQQAGHHVLWATSQDSCARLDEYGFRSTPAGMSSAERNTASAAEMPAIMALEPRQRRGRIFSTYFAKTAGPRMLTDLQDVFDSFDPDLVVHETAELAAAPMAAARGLPHVTVAFGGAIPGDGYEILLESVVPLWASEDLGPPTMADLFGDLYLHPFPASFGQQPDLGALQLMRPETFVPDPDVEAPEWMRDFGTERPGIYLTFGTEAPAAQAPWQNVLEAIGQQDADCIATFGSHIDPERLGPIPPNVQIVQYLPHHLVLDRASAVICHGGAGTVLAAAGRGLPQLVIPMGADQWDNGDAVAASGAGIVAEADGRGSDKLAESLRALLEDDRHREAAIRVASEIAAMPSAAEYVSVIETLDEI